MVVMERKELSAYESKCPELALAESEKSAVWF